MIAIRVKTHENELGSLQSPKSLVDSSMVGVNGYQTLNNDLEESLDQRILGFLFKQKKQNKKSSFNNHNSASSELLIGESYLIESE